MNCWGSNQFRQLGVPHGRFGGRLGGIAYLSDVREARDIAASLFAACVAERSGRVQCWGLWEPITRLGGDKAPGQEPRAIDGIDDAQQVALGEFVACALRTGGRITCWGDNNSGQLGVSATTPAR